MKKCLLSALLSGVMLSCTLSAQAALVIDTAVNESGGNRIVSMIMANPAEENLPAESEAAQATMQALVDANTLIQTRFPLAQYLTAMNRVGAREDGVTQTLRLYQDASSASLAVIWQGEQADGTRGCSVQSLAIDLETGAEIPLEALFADPEAAFAEMEETIETQIVDELSDYMEYADLLPMPRDCFSYDESGLTVYYPQERYLYFSGRSGAVHFAWHEIDHLIAQESAAYALSRPQAGGAQAIEEQMTTGKLPGMTEFGVGDRLGDALEAYTLLSDPDYTTESLVYQFEQESLRGFALEIPKYAETEKSETPVSAVRSTRCALFGLETGETTKTDAIALLGEPEQTRSYDAELADGMMLEPGESLFYGIGGHVLQLHFGADDVLRTVLLRSGMPESWL